MFLNNFLKKILFIITALETGGAERILVSLLENLDRNQFQPKLIILGEVGPLVERLDCEWEQINFKKISVFRGFIKLTMSVLSFRPHLIQGWMYHGSLFAIISNFLWPFSQCYLGIRNQKVDEGTLSVKTQKILVLLKKLQKFSDLTIYPSKESKKTHELEGFEESKAKIIENGCNIEIYKPVTEGEKLQLREKWVISSETRVLAYVSRFHPHKDPETFFKAISILVKTYPDLKVVCAGQGFVPENHELTKMLKNLSIEENIVLMGVVKNIHEVYQFSDGLVLSSIGEAFPNVLIEAMSCGLKCVSTDVGNVKQLLAPFEGVVETRNPEILAQAIKSNLLEDSHVKVDMKRSEWIKNNYSISNMVSSFEKEWSKV